MSFAKLTFNRLLSSSQNHESRYAFLDGMRGLAAIIILTRHTGDFFHYGFFRSYLAVDLFFILSGFVIAHAYDEKLKNSEISLRKFLIIRLIRLYPMFFLSILLCSILLIIGDQFNQNLQQNIKSILMSVLMLPSHLDGTPRLFPTNGAYWSLFFELVANFIYALARPFLNNFTLKIVVFSFFLLLANISYTQGNLNNGYDWGFESISAGFVRSIFGIFLGLILFRYKLYFEKYIKDEATFYEPDNVSDLTDKIKQMFNNLTDLKNKVDNARRKVEDYKWSSRAESILDMINR
jgi:peptidoglycan/LPS O-acetylase OafA/YrhL